MMAKVRSLDMDLPRWFGCAENGWPADLATKSWQMEWAEYHRRRLRAPRKVVTDSWLFRLIRK
jgi:hypothetical protein